MEAELYYHFISNPMEKTILEITLTEKIDAFKLSDYLNRNKDLKASVVTCNSIRVRFSPEKMAEKLVLKLIQQFSSKDHRDRKCNVKHIKQVQDDSFESAA